jgi:hypothetical protein
MKKPECDAFVGKDVWVAFKAPERLSETVERKVPLGIERALPAFREAHPEARVVGDFLVADVKRKVTEPQNWLRTCVAKKYHASH